MRVVLFERERFPRHRPGETLPPGVEPIFAQLGVAEAVRDAQFVRHPGTWVSWAGPRRFDPFGEDADGPWLGYQAPRVALDSLLLAAVAQAAVGVRQPCRALDPIVDGGRVVGVATTEGPVLARWVIDAGGGTHWLARRLGIPLEEASPRLVARYGYVEGSCPERDDAPEIAADADGWSWSARVAPGRYHWTRLSFTPGDPQRDVPPEPLAGLRPVARTWGADVTWRIVARPAGPGYLCAGDAAFVLDPASSHGVVKALMSGMMAAHAIAQARSGATSERAAAEGYAAWLRDWFRADATELIRLYRSLPFPPAWACEAVGGRR